MKMEDNESEIQSVQTESDSEQILTSNEVQTSVQPNIFESLCLVELCRSSWYPATENSDKQTYLRGCKWSPDGTCCLTVVNNGGVHVLELPRDLYQGTEVSENRPIDVLDSVIKLAECGLIYDYCWYPGMNSLVPESCCWLTTRQHSPVQLWDAFDGALRCSYRGYNNVDEVEAALSVCFSSDGTQIHAGYKKSLKTFNTDRPGRECTNQPIHSSASSLAVSPTCESLMAVGSWSTEISLYNIYDGNTKSIGKLRYHSGGVTHLQFLPDGTKLVSGARKDSSLLVWDVRFYKSPLKVLHRKVDTNQRVYFDISRCGRYLVSGGTDGIVSTWDLSEEVATQEANRTYKQTLYPLHSDCCNGVSIHPYRPILATSSGQHHISNENLENDCEESAKLEPSKTNYENDVSIMIVDNTESKVVKKKVIENSLQFWWTGKSTSEEESAS